LESKAEVASSKIIILGFLIKALAMEILWRCPPLILQPLYPMMLEKPSGNLVLSFRNYIQPALSAEISISYTL
jgi:hypothetical protein